MRRTPPDRCPVCICAPMLRREARVTSAARVSDPFKTEARSSSYRRPMTLHCDLAGMVVADMGKSLAFYRRLGLDIPPEADDQPHVDFELPGGFRIAWDTIDVIKSFDPSWT